MFLVLSILFFLYYRKKVSKKPLFYHKAHAKKELAKVVNPLSNQDKTMKDSTILKRLIFYTHGQTKRFIVAFLFMLIVVSTSLVQPLVVGQVYTILKEDSPLLSQILFMVFLYAGLMVTSSLVNYFQTMALQKAGQQIIYELRSDVFNKLESLSIEQLNTVPVGKLVTRVTSDTNAINQMYTNVLINGLRNVLMIIGVLIAMFFVNVELATYVVLITPFIILFSFIFRKYSKQTYRDVRHNISKVNASLSENISGIKITQAFVQEQKQLAQFDEINNNLSRSKYRQTFIFGIFRPSMYVLYITTVILILFVASKSIIDSNFVISFNIIVIFYEYIDYLYNPIQNLAEQFNMLQSALAAAERVFLVLDMDIDVKEEINAKEVSHLKGEIEFKHVWFKYQENSDWILKDVSFHIAQNETVAFVGATGAGKTTILGLMVRNFDCQKGEILIDNIPIKEIKLDSLRGHIGQMLQDVFLFSGTVASNISLNDESISMDTIKEASKFVNADKIIEKLPNKYEEVVRERGNNFSSGERQLLSFARVVAHKPDIMILDEATSNIDTETEVLIQDSLHKIMNIGTMLMVAHRLSTIQHSDRIIVLNHGEIIEIGNHQELLEKKGYYYKLYRLQFEKDIKNK